jgi:hypothetical protein
VGLADLDSVDLVTGEGDKALWIVTDSDWPESREALEYTQLIVKLGMARAEAHRAREAGDRCTVLVHSAGEPPASVLEHLRANDVPATVGTSALPRPARGRRSAIPNLADGQPDLTTMQVANAAAFAQEFDLDGSPDSLILLDDVLDERRFERGLDPDDTDETYSDGDLIVTAGAYTGEVLRHAVRGSAWWLGPAGVTWPVHIRAGLGHGTRIDVFDRVSRYLRYGAKASVHALVASALVRLA